jgi:hypothetical protein
MPRWPAILLACIPGCATPVEAPIDSSPPPAVFVEAPCTDTPGEIAYYFNGRIGLRLPADVTAKEVPRQRGHIVMKLVDVGCDRAPVWITLIEVEAASISLAILLDTLARTTGGGGRPTRLEFIRPHLDGFSLAVSDIQSNDPRHAYVRVMMPSALDPPRYHAIKFNVRSQDWEALLPTLRASAESMVRRRP